MNLKEIVLFVAFVISYGVGGQVQSYEVKLRWVNDIEDVYSPPNKEEIEETEKPQEKKVGVCQFSNNDLIAFCNDAKEQYLSRKMLNREIVFEDPQIIEPARSHKVRTKSWGITWNKVILACKCPLNVEIYLLDKLQSKNKVNAIAIKPRKSEQQRHSQAYVDPRHQPIQPVRAKNESCCTRCCRHGCGDPPDIAPTNPVSTRPTATWIDGFMWGWFCNSAGDGICQMIGGCVNECCNTGVDCIGKCCEGGCNCLEGCLKIACCCCCCCDGNGGGGGGGDCPDCGNCNC